ncbi:MAG: hypothetical protein H5T63_08425, partial [Chloroflexi bacterium]|nr:hypothetical protein [Chloroflexota bacterium]
MTKKRIIAHFMHAEEEAAALQKMTNVQRTESYVLGEIDEADIAALRQEGLVIQVLEEQPRVETPGEEVEPVPGSVVRRARYEPSAKAPEPTVDR